MVGKLIRLMKLIHLDESIAKSEVKIDEPSLSAAKLTIPSHIMVTSLSRYVDFEGATYRLTLEEVEDTK